MNSKVYEIQMSKGNVKVRIYCTDRRVRTVGEMPVSSKRGQALLNAVKSWPHDTYRQGSTVTYWAAINPSKPIVREEVDGEWIDPEAEQLRDEQTPTRITPDPIPDWLITDIWIAGEQVTVDVRQGGEGRPLMHFMNLHSAAADKVFELISDHLFTFEARGTKFHMHANELIPTPFNKDGSLK